jgi:hypothetical protein
LAALVQRLTGVSLLALLATAVPAADFSHRLHLKMKLECVGCHASVTNSTKVEDDNLPDKQVCLGCHKEATIKAPRRTLVAKFNHRQHLKMGNIAPVIAAAIDSGAYLSPRGEIRKHLDTKNPCVACHRGLESSDKVTAADMPQMADCLVCHNKIEPPFSCTQCHREGAALKPASHVPEFTDDHSSGKMKLDKASCAVCHGRKFTCRGCH